METLNGESICYWIVPLQDTLSKRMCVSKEELGGEGGCWGRTCTKQTPGPLHRRQVRVYWDLQARAKASVTVENPFVICLTSPVMLSPAVTVRNKDGAVSQSSQVNPEPWRLTTVPTWVSCPYRNHWTLDIKGFISPPLWKLTGACWHHSAPGCWQVIFSSKGKRAAGGPTVL